MTKAPRFTGPRLAEASFVSATVQSVRRCPARSDFIELCFVTDEGSWTWCFPDPADQTKRGSAARVALTVGPYGPQARYVDDAGLGNALPTSEALPIILCGCQTYVARKLVERER